MSSKKHERDGSKLKGVIVAAVTPRQPQDCCIDLGATLELVDFLGASGVTGIALLGSTGEFVHFGVDDRKHMVNLAAKRSRVPLLVNVSHSTLDGAVELAREAAGAGVAGVLLMPPYYFKHSQETIRSFYFAFAAAIGEAVPSYLYNIPDCTNEIASSTASELLASGRFAGIKDSSGSLAYFGALREQARRTPFTLLAGHEKIYVQCKLLGAQGIVSGVASAVPELMVALENALTSRGDHIHLLEARLHELLERLGLFAWPVAIKEAVRQRGLKPGALAAPLGEEDKRKLGEFGEWFRGWLATVLSECASTRQAAGALSAESGQK